MSLEKCLDAGKPENVLGEDMVFLIRKMHGFTRPRSKLNIKIWS